MDQLASLREGETALSPQRNGGLARVTAKEGVRGGTMGCPPPNICRCTGYHNIVRAVEAAAKAGA